MKEENCQSEKGQHQEAEMTSAQTSAERERRKFKRFDAYMSVKCNRLPNAQALNILGLSRDVSRDGVCINSNEAIEKGSMVELEIDLPDDPRPIKTTGRIVWSKTATSKDEGVDYGVQFLTIDPIDKFRVLDYAYNHWLETKVNDFSDPEEISELN